MKNKRIVSSNEISALMLVSSASQLGNLALTTRPMSLAVTTILAGAICASQQRNALATQVWDKQLMPIWKWSKRRFGKVQQPSFLTRLLFVGSGGLYLLNALATPASAQFMNNAQSWMQGVFPVGGEAIPLVFNVLRGLFILYLGIALVQVVQAARQDEDWKTLARTPLILMITVVLGDVLTGFIVGTGGGSGTP